MYLKFLSTDIWLFMSGIVRTEHCTYAVIVRSESFWTWKICPGAKNFLNLQSTFTRNDDPMCSMLWYVQKDEM